MHETRINFPIIPLKKYANSIGSGLLNEKPAGGTGRFPAGFQASIKGLET